MFKFRRTKFFDGFRQHFGKVGQDLVDPLDTLLDQTEKDNRFEETQDVRTGRRQLAYCLATFKWETAHNLFQQWGF